MATNVEDAAHKGLKDLSEKLVPTVLDKLSRHIKGIAKKVKVKVHDVRDISTNFEIKEKLQNIAWVANVEKRGLGEFVVSYPENTVYLANSINQKGNLRVVNFSPYSITVKYSK